MLILINKNQSLKRQKITQNNQNVKTLENHDFRQEDAVTIVVINIDTNNEAAQDGNWNNREHPSTESIP